MRTNNNTQANGMENVIKYAAELLNAGATVTSFEKFGFMFREIRQENNYVCLCASDFAKAAAIAAGMPVNNSDEEKERREEAANAERTANRSAEFLAAFKARKAQAMKATKKAAQATAKAAGRVALRVFRVLWFVAILAASVATMFGCGYALGTVTPHSLPVLLRILVFFVCVGAPALFVEYVLLRISKAMDNATGRRLFAMS